MKTVSYILRVEPGRTSGSAGPRGQGCGLPSGRDKVVDLAAWRAEHLTELDGPETRQMSAPGRYGRREPLRRGRRTAWDWMELAATLAVAAALLALAVRVLLF